MLFFVVAFECVDVKETYALLVLRPTRLPLSGFDCRLDWNQYDNFHILWLFLQYIHINVTWHLFTLILCCKWKIQYKNTLFLLCVKNLWNDKFQNNQYLPCLRCIIWNYLMSKMEFNLVLYRHEYLLRYGINIELGIV